MSSLVKLHFSDILEFLCDSVLIYADITKFISNIYNCMHPSVSTVIVKNISNSVIVCS